jgi:hypothetical protein
MSTVPATPSDAVPAPRSADRSKLLRWVGGGGLVAAGLAALTLAVWPASETDRARSDGEHFGQAVAALHAAQSPEDVDDALADLHAAASDTREHVGDAIAAQIDDQRDALDRAADGFVGSRTSDDEFSADVYQAELETAVDDLASQASDFRAQGTDVQQAFWEGYQNGLDGD